MTLLRRGAAAVQRNLMDLFAVTGVVLVGIGLGMYSLPLLPIAIGVGLLATVRFGSR